MDRGNKLLLFKIKDRQAYFADFLEIYFVAEDYI